MTREVLKKNVPRIEYILLQKQDYPQNDAVNDNLIVSEYDLLISKLWRFIKFQARNKKTKKRELEYLC